jgi:uroporphyrin-III C-methyltransferase/precorrin-2 dehydrogenase/sirohydrochlorin ferrochelatase
MRTFLAAVPLERARVVVVGDGEAALAKLRLFLNSPAELAWIAPGGAPDAATIPRDTPAPAVRPAEAGDFAGARLVFIAVDQEAEAARLAALARAAGAQVNVVDRPGLGDFQTPALVDRDELVVAIATGGGAPILARDLRAKLEAELPAALGPLAGLARELRDRVKASIPDFMARRRFWERAFRGAAVELVAAGRIDEAREEILRLIDEAAPEDGWIALIGTGPGDPELMTVKATRLLQDIDILIHDQSVGDAVLARARRDAGRVALDATAGDFHARALALMIDQARSGHRVARLFHGDPGEAGELEQAALAAAGVTTITARGLAPP